MNALTSPNPSGGERTFREWLVALLDLERASNASDQQMVVRERPNPLPDVNDYRRPVALPEVSEQRCSDFDAQRRLVESCGTSACHGPGSTSGYFVANDAPATRELLSRVTPNPGGPCADHETFLPGNSGDGLLLSKLLAPEGLCGAPMPITGGPRSIDAEDMACLVDWIRGL